VWQCCCVMMECVSVFAGSTVNWGTTLLTLDFKPSPVNDDFAKYACYRRTRNNVASVDNMWTWLLQSNPRVSWIWDDNWCDIRSLR
jgi:hypothetical protein